MVHKLNRRPSRKSELFTAAAELVAERGIEALTIENVAQAAHVSKGGVQYHFATKDQLIIELLGHLLAAFDEAIGAETGDNWLSTYVMLTLAAQTPGDGAVAAILAALPPGDIRSAPFEHFSRKWREQTANCGIEPALAQVIRLAADAQWLERSYGGATPAETTAILKQLQTMIRENSK